MSPGCSSPRELNIAPLPITAVTHGLIVTFWPRLYKRDLKLTYSCQMFFTRAEKKRETGTRFKMFFFFFLALGLIILWSDPYCFSHLSDFVWGFISAPENHPNTWKAGSWRVATKIGQLNISQYLMCRTGSEFVGYNLEVSVLQASAWPRVGGVFLYTICLPFSDTRLLIFFFYSPVFIPLSILPCKVIKTCKVSQ